MCRFASSSLKGELFLMFKQEAGKMSVFISFNEIAVKPALVGVGESCRFTTSP